MMSKLNLTPEEVARVRSWYTSNYDKYPRMFSGLSSDLMKYVDGIIHIEISNTQQCILSTQNTAIFFACKYRKHIPELRDAVGFHVTFMDRNNSPGFVIKADASEEEIKNKCDQYNQPEMPHLNSVYSGLFKAEMKYISQDLVKKEEPRSCVEDEKEINNFIDKRVFRGEWIKVVFNFMVIRNEAIVKKFDGNLIDFANKYDTCMNNDLNIACFMAWGYLEEKVELLEQDLGLERYTDFIIGREHNIEGVYGKSSCDDSFVTVDEVDWIEFKKDVNLGVVARLK